ncbi:MAG: hypothetical protein AAB863_03160 [Patescibacteria group bacterium]
MLLQEERFLLRRLGLTEKQARREQKKDKYEHLVDYLATECRHRDQEEFLDLLEIIKESFLSRKDFQSAWKLLKNLKRFVTKLEKK